MKRIKYVGTGRIPGYPPLNAIRKDLYLKSGMNYIIVEGKDNSNDNEVYRNVIVDNCKIQPSGKKETIINDFKTVYKNQIAIVDKDYDDNVELNNIFYTDYNDIECTAINIIDNSNEIYNSLRIRGMTNIDFNEKVYKKALELSCRISSLNRYIHDYCNNKYMYILKFFVNKDEKKSRIVNIRKTTIGNIREIGRILSKNNNIKYNEIINIYKERYGKDFNISLEKIQNIMDTYDNTFRGHDFFIMLAYLIDNYHLAFDDDLKDEFKLNSSDFLESRFIKYFSKTKRIKESNMYNEIKSTKEGFLE